MMQKHKNNQMCTFMQCYPTPIYLQQEDLQQKYSRRDSRCEKISLKRVQSKQVLINIQPISENRQTKMNQIRTPVFIEPINTIALTPRIISTPISPKPKITFAWKTDLQRTKKAQNKEQVQPNPHVIAPELQKTKPVSKMLKIGSNLHLSAYKASLISIPDNQPKHPPKVEESLIVVNYFNPSTQQRKTLQTYLEKKGSKEQN